MAGRTALASASLNSIPNHVMQYSYLHIRIIKYIDKIQKTFIWGSTLTSKKIHLLSWDTLTKDKEKEGLGIHSAKDKNLVILASLSWRLLHNPQLSWSQILTSLYGVSKNLKITSFIWKCVIKGWNFFNKGLKWIPHSNSSMNIWETNWIPKISTLRSEIEGPLTIPNRKLTIKEILLNNKWDLTKITFQLPHHIKNAILSRVAMTPVIGN